MCPLNSNRWYGRSGGPRFMFIIYRRSAAAHLLVSSPDHLRAALFLTEWCPWSLRPLTSQFSSRALCWLPLVRTCHSPSFLRRGGGCVGGAGGLLPAAVGLLMLLPQPLPRRGWGEGGGVRGQKQFVYLKSASNFRPLSFFAREKFF